MQTSKDKLNSFIKNLPSPLNKEKFSLLKKGIWDNNKIDVFINKKKDFTFLFPQPEVNYEKYVPRKKKIGLTAYKEKIVIQENQRRYFKIHNHFNDCKNLLEIGSGDGKFLKLINSKNKKIQLSSLEKDSASNRNYKKIKWLKTFTDFSQINGKFDIICFFHVLEHIYQPDIFLKKIKNIMSTNAKIILEVPSLTDPIRNLYKVKEYTNFFFQSQHPYTYTSKSLKRILKKNFIIQDTIHFQRYGIDNHFSWLVKKIPGGDEELLNLFKKTNENYIEDLEKSKNTDSVIMILRNKG